MINKQKNSEYCKRWRLRHHQKFIEMNRNYRQKIKHERKGISLLPPEIGCEHKPMLRYEGRYQIYLDGQVWSYKTGKWKKAALQSNGRYYFYCLSIGKNKRKTQYVHRLIAENFILSRQLQKDYQIHHLDKNTKNNLPENLKVVDPISHKQFHKVKPRN